MKIQDIVGGVIEVWLKESYGKKSPFSVKYVLYGLDASGLLLRRFDPQGDGTVKLLKLHWLSLTNIYLFTQDSTIDEYLKKHEYTLIGETIDPFGNPPKVK